MSQVYSGSYMYMYYKVQQETTLTIFRSRNLFSILLLSKACNFWECAAFGHIQLKGVQLVSWSILLINVKKNVNGTRKKERILLKRNYSNTKWSKRIIALAIKTSIRPFLSVLIYISVMLLHVLTDIDVFQVSLLLGYCSYFWELCILQILYYVFLIVQLIAFN